MCFISSSYQQHTVIIQHSMAFLVEELQQLRDGHLFAFLAADIQNYSAVIHHNCAVAHLQRRADIVGNHHSSDIIVFNDFIRQLQHFLGSCRVQSRCMLIQQQQLGRDHSSHHQRQCLPLTAGEQADLAFQTIFQTQTQLRELFLKESTFFVGDAKDRTLLVGTQINESQIFLDSHIRCSTAQRILKEPAYLTGTLIFRLKSDIPAVQPDTAGIQQEAAADSIKDGTLAGAVAADDTDKITRCKVQRKVSESLLGIRGTFIKSLVDITQFQHGSILPG